MGKSLGYAEKIIYSLQLQKTVLDRLKAVAMEQSNREQRFVYAADLIREAIERAYPREVK